MKANFPLSLAPLCTLLLLAACASPPPPPPPVVAAPRPLPTPPPPPPPRVHADWRDAPQTPGTWRWSLESGRSTARFHATSGQALAVLQCDRPGGSVWLARNAAGSPPVLMVVRTTGLAPRGMTSLEAAAPGGWIGVKLPPHDPVLDAIAFSRGRFALEAAGHQTLYLPAWPELSRVVEDCR